MTTVMSEFLLSLLPGGNREFYFLDPAMVQYQLPGWNTLDSLDWIICPFLLILQSGGQLNGIHLSCYLLLCYMSLKI